MNSAARRQAVKAARPLPRQEDRLAARRAMLAVVARHQRPGSGSMLERLLEGDRPTMQWWPDVVRTLRAAGVRPAAAGAVAANAYMPPRQTADIDLAVALADLASADEAMAAAGWSRVGEFRLYEDLKGTAWAMDERGVDLIGLPGEWGRTAVEEAQRNVRDGLPTLTLPFVVLTKLISARMQDAADITRMLGAASDAQRDAVRRVVERWRPQDAADLEQMIAAGRLEFGR